MTTVSGADEAEPTDARGVPLLRVVNADATAEEIAALVAVLASLGGVAPGAPRRAPEWQAHHRKVRATLPQGPGGWRSSALPR
jgi:hypothetical protein